MSNPPCLAPDKVSGDPRKSFSVDQKLHAFKKWRLQYIIVCNNFLEGFEPYGDQNTES